MKKYLLLASITICIGIIIPCKLHAVDFTVGATTWYTWWDLNMDLANGEGKKKIDIDPGFLYGPVLGVKFNDDFNLTFVYLLGKFNLNDPIEIKSTKETSEISRTDVDLALNYRLNDYFKIFAGIKSMSFYFASEWDHGNMGPGLGLSAIYPLDDNLFLIANLSGFYFFTTGYEEAWKFKEYGMNSTLSLAYYITSISTTVSLGGRFQYSKSTYSPDDALAPSREPTTQNFYGITLTATYTF